MNTPYTYLIGWSKLNIWYYGVRYSKNCDPNDLWKTYFTSSKSVKKFTLENGNPDIIQIRKTFKDKNSAIIWESRVLTKLNVIHKEEWLNKTNNKAIVYTRTKEQNTKFSNKMKGRKSPFKGKSHTPESKKLISDSNKGRFTGIKRTFTDEWKFNIGKSSKGRVRLQSDSEKQNRSISAIDTGFNKINSGKIWINNGISNKRIYPDQLHKFTGYIRGRIFT